MKGVCHFGIKGKLAPHYIGPYPIIDKYGPLSYQVELPSKLSGVHNVFHVSQLKRCLNPPADVVVKDTIPLEPNLTYKAYPIKILDQQDRVTRNKTTQIYKVQLNDHSEDEATWSKFHLNLQGFQFNLNLNLQIQVNNSLDWTSNSSPWIELVTRCNCTSLVQVSSKLDVPRRNSSKFY
jgi:hypothetical protein